MKAATRVAPLVEVTIWHCRYCGKPVQQRGRHESRCAFNPQNRNKKQIPPAEPKLAISFNISKTQIAVLRELVEKGELESQSVFVRACLKYVLSNDSILKGIMEGIDNGEYE